jgi:hypothetical protein
MSSCGLGSALVAVAALTFAVAWRRLGDTGRAGLPFAMTFVAAGTAYGLVKRLPATAEALGGLTLALILVDWFVLRQAGSAPASPRRRGGRWGRVWRPASPWPPAPGCGFRR